MITPPNNGLGKVAKSSRGLELVRFKDAIGVPCVVQSVTLAYSENGMGIAIGAEKAKPKLQARDAKALGIKTVQKTGFVAFPFPDEVTFDTRAVLTRRQVVELVRHLNGWLYSRSMAALPWPVEEVNAKVIYTETSSGLSIKEKLSPIEQQRIREEAHGLDEKAIGSPKLSDEVQNGG